MHFSFLNLKYFRDQATNRIVVYKNAAHNKHICSYNFAYLLTLK